jgi:hypothetical protein
MEKVVHELRGIAFLVVMMAEQISTHPKKEAGLNFDFFVRCANCGEKWTKDCGTKEG